MDLWLYTTATPNNYVNKILSNDTKLTFYTKNQNTDIMSPSIILNGDVAGFCGFNYAYIPRYNRYYFFNKPPVALDNNRVQIDLEVDVLSSFWNEIKNNSALINRSQSHFNRYLIDEKQKQEAHTRVVLKKWGYTFHPDRTALVGVCGGGVFD